MTSRKGSIIGLADAKSSLLLDAVPERFERKRRNLAAIRLVCKSLIERRTPRLPTAKLVSEVGANKDETFPSPQTIYNEYREMIGIWRKAFDDIVVLDAPDPIQIDTIHQIDTSALDAGTRFIIDELRHHIAELQQRVNALKVIIGQTVPVPADDLQANADEVIGKLDEWLLNIPDGPLEFDEIGLQVSARSRPGFIIMDADLFNMLRTLVDDYLMGQRARSAS